MKVFLYTIFELLLTIVSTHFRIILIIGHVLLCSIYVWDWIVVVFVLFVFVNVVTIHTNL